MTIKFPQFNDEEMIAYVNHGDKPHLAFRVIIKLLYLILLCLVSQIEINNGRN